VERVLRDVRINRIIEGTSEIMHLFIAREALDPHLSRMKPLLSGRTPIGAKLMAALKMGIFYAGWYPKLWGGFLTPADIARLPHPLQEHMMYARRASRRLARGTFHKMALYQQKLESKQSILNRIVDIGTELFVITSVCSYAVMLHKKGQKTALDLAVGFCLESRKRVDALFLETAANNDRVNLGLAKKVLGGDFTWMENEVIK
jgi:hypothetical protein